MTYFFDEFQVRERLRELQALDRQMERWGWFRRQERPPRVSAWRFRLGEGLVRLGFRLQGRSEVEGSVVSEEPRLDRDGWI
jgi:hypothetical protein